MFSPSTSKFPDSGLSNPNTNFKIVDLPLPEPPIKTILSPGLTEKLTSLRINWSEKPNKIFSNTIA